MYTFKLLHTLLQGHSQRTRRLAKNVVGVTAIRYISYALELIKVPILLSYLDKEKYGVWLTIVSILLWTNQFDLGLGSGLRYEFSKAIAKEDIARGKILVSTAYYSMTAIMTVTFLIIGSISFVLNWNSILNVATIQNEELVMTIICLLAIFVARFVFQLIQTILLADQRAALSSIFLPISTFLSLICILSIKFIKPNSLFLASVAMALPYLVVLIGANLYFFRKDYSIYKPSIELFQKNILKDIYSLGGKFFVSQFASLIIFSTSNILITQIIGPEDVTIYNIARQYFYLPITFITIFLVSFSAPITEAYVKADMQWVQRIMKKLKTIALLLSGLVLIMLLSSDFAFYIWTQGKIQVPHKLSILLSIYAIMNMFASPYGEFLGGIGKFSVRMYISIFKIITFVPIAIIMMKYWQLNGLVLAVCLVNTSLNLIFGEIQYQKIITGKAKGIWNK